MDCLDSQAIKESCPVSFDTSTGRDILLLRSVLAILLSLDLIVLSQIHMLPLLLIHLLVLHALLKLDQNILVIIDHIALIVQPFPLDDPVTAKLRYSLGVEHVAGRFECFSAFLGVDVLDQRWEKENHVPAFVHDRRAAVGTRHLAWEMVRCVFVGGIIPAEVVVSIGEVDVALVEDGCPLEWCLWMVSQSVLFLEPIVRNGYYSPHAVSGTSCSDSI